MTYNRTDIMNTAWANTRDLMQRFGYSASQLRDVFRIELAKAWQKAKAAAALATRSAASLRDEVTALENRTHLGHDGLSLLDNLRAALVDAEAREAMEAKRQMIAAAQGRFCSVTFTKKDGSERTMRIQPAALRHHVKGAKAAPAARRAALTRAKRHPHLMPVWDADKHAPRSVNLTTISRIAVDGAVHHFQA